MLFKGRCILSDWAFMRFACVIVLSLIRCNLRDISDIGNIGMDLCGLLHK